MELDINQIYKDSLDSWKEYWDDDSSLYLNTRNLINELVALPKRELLSTVAAVYILTSSRCSMVLPVLFSYGDAGTGKSTISILASKLHGLNNTFNAADTFASIRISLNNMRFGNPNALDEEPEERDGAFLPWDNIHAETFIRDNKIYQMILSGYDRNTDKINVAGSNGDIRSYYTFAPKSLSSTEELHLNPKFSELRRRMFIIPHKKFNKFLPIEKEDYDSDFTTEDLLDINSVHWEGIETVFYDFWTDAINVQNFVLHRKSLSKKKQTKLKIPKNINSDRWTISIDFLATGLTLGAFNSPQDGVNFLSDYFAYIDEFVMNELGSTRQYIRDFIHQETATAYAINKDLVAKNMRPYPVYVDATKLKNYLDALQAQGKLDDPPIQKTINRIMRDEGWTLKKEGWTER